jgi:drug/metabolite transporter (DMT)-like permease
MASPPAQGALFCWPVAICLSLLPYMKKAFLQLHLAVLLAGFTGVFGKLITLNEGLLVWYRLLFSGLLLGLLLLAGRRLKKITPAGFLKIAAAGSLLALHWIFFYGSIKYANISVGVICFSLTSFFTALLEPLINRKRFVVTELLLSGLTLCGIGLIFHFDASYRLGIALGVISAILVAGFTIANERLVMQYDTRIVTLYEMLGGFLCVSLLLPLYLHLFPVPSIWPSAADTGYLLLLSLFCTVGLYLLVTQALRRISAFTVNLSFNLEPVYSIVLAMVIYRENKELTWAFYTGLALIVLSLVLQMLKVTAEHRREKNKAVAA